MFNTPKETTTPELSLAPGAILQLRDYKRDIYKLERYAQFELKLQSSIGDALASRAYDACYTALISRYFAYSQAIPVKGQQNLGSLFNQGLLRAYGMQKAVDEYFQQPSVATEVHAELIRYAVFSAGLLRRIHQLYTAYQIIICESKGEFKAVWSPVLGDLQQQASSFCYRIRAVERNLNDVNAPINVLLAKNCMPDRGMNWIANSPDIFQQWLKLLTGEQGLIGPFAHALQNSQDFIEGLDLDGDWAEYEIVPELELGEALLAWLEQLNEHDLRRLSDAVVDTDEGIAFELELLFKAYINSPQGQMMTERMGGGIIQFASFSQQFRAIYASVGYDAQFRALRNALMKGRGPVSVFVVPHNASPLRAAATKASTAVKLQVPSERRASLGQPPSLPEKATKTQSSALRFSASSTRGH